MTQNIKATNSDQLSTQKSLISHDQIFDQLKHLGYVSGKLLMPCAPTMLEHYVSQVKALLDISGTKFTTEQLAALKQQIAECLEAGFAASQHSHLVIHYEPAKPPQTNLVINISYKVASLKDFYEQSIREYFGNSLDDMETTVFGKVANAKVIDVAMQLGEPRGTRILDIGAGSGRNTLPLARLGYSVDAIDLAEVFCKQLQSSADRENLPVVVTQGNILDPLFRLRFGHYKLVVLAEVLPHFRDVDQVRLAFVKICDALQSGGLFLFNIFLVQEEYEPDVATRQVAQVFQAFFLTRTELAIAMAGLPLEMLSEQSVFAYERDHLPPEAFPPSPWFVKWSTGQLVFGENTEFMSLQWILCTRK